MKQNLAPLFSLILGLSTAFIAGSVTANDGTLPFKTAKGHVYYAATDLSPAKFPLKIEDVTIAPSNPVRIDRRYSSTTLDESQATGLHILSCADGSDDVEQFSATGTLFYKEVKYTITGICFSKEDNTYREILSYSSDKNTQIRLQGTLDETATLEGNFNEYKDNGREIVSLGAEKKFIVFREK